MYSVFEYYLNNILFVFGHNSESEYYSYSYLAKILIPNNIRIRSKKQYSLTSEAKRCHEHVFATVSNNYLHPPTCLARRTVTSFLGTCYTYLEEEIARTVQTLNVSCIKKR